MSELNKIVDEINNIGNINSVDFGELEAALQAMKKVASTIGVTFTQAGMALRTVLDRLNSVKTYEEEHYSTAFGAQSHAEGYYSTAYGSQSTGFKTIYGILEEKEE